MSAEKIPYGDGDSRFDPTKASERDVIGWFLTQAEDLTSSDEAAKYVATLLGVKDDGVLSEVEDSMRTRLRAIIMDSDISDERWEDEDDIAGEIYAQLRATKEYSDELMDQRKALRYLLQLRGADVKSEEESGVTENEHTTRWEILLRKIGSKALR